MIARTLLIAASLLSASGVQATEPLSRAPFLDSRPGEPAWFAQHDATVRWCIQTSSRGQGSEEKLYSAFTVASHAWIRTIFAFGLDRFHDEHDPALAWFLPVFEKDEPGLAHRFSYLRQCDGSEQLTLYLGDGHAPVEAVREEYEAPWSIVHRESYDPETGMGRGWIWLRKEAILSKDILETVLAHALGHVYGCDHLPKSVMQENLQEFWSESGQLLGEERLIDLNVSPASIEKGKTTLGKVFWSNSSRPVAVDRTMDLKVAPAEARRGKAALGSFAFHAPGIPNRWKTQKSLSEKESKRIASILLGRSDITDLEIGATIDGDLNHRAGAHQGILPDSVVVHPHDDRLMLTLRSPSLPNRGRVGRDQRNVWLSFEPSAPLAHQSKTETSVFRRRVSGRDFSAGSVALSHTGWIETYLNYNPTDKGIKGFAASFKTADKKIPVEKLLIEASGKLVMRIRPEGSSEPLVIELEPMTPWEIEKDTHYLD